MKNKLFIIILVLLVTLIFCACSYSGSDNSAQENQTANVLTRSELDKEQEEVANLLESSVGYNLYDFALENNFARIEVIYKHYQYGALMEEKSLLNIPLDKNAAQNGKIALLTNSDSMDMNNVLSNKIVVQTDSGRYYVNKTVLQDENTAPFINNKRSLPLYGKVNIEPNKEVPIWADFLSDTNEADSIGSPSQISENPSENLNAVRECYLFSCVFHKQLATAQEEYSQYFENSIDEVIEKSDLGKTYVEMFKDNPKEFVEMLDMEDENIRWEVGNLLVSGFSESNDLETLLYDLDEISNEAASGQESASVQLIRQILQGT